MSILHSLKLTAALPARASTNPVERARQKVIEGLTIQRSMVDAKLAGQHYAPTQMVWRKNEEGQKIRVEAPRRLKASWFQDTSGQTFFSLRYAGKILELAKGKTSVAVGDLAALPAIIDTLTEAVRAGELDAQLAAAAAERGLMLRKVG